MIRTLFLYGGNKKITMGKMATARKTSKKELK